MDPKKSNKPPLLLIQLMPCISYKRLFFQDVTPHLPF